MANVVRVRILSNRAGVLIKNTKPFEREGKGKQKILILGDSLAYGTGTSSSEKSVAGLVAAHYPEAAVINKSANGKRTNELANEVEKLNDNYDVILIIIGGNDILRPWINLNESATNLNKIYSTASKHSTKVIALTTGNFKYTTLFLWPANLYYEGRSVELRDSAIKISKELPNVVYVDMVERNKTVPFDHVKEAPDHLHLSDEGAKYWHDAIKERVNF